jgi:hypothetical protein
MGDQDYTCAFCGEHADDHIGWERTCPPRTKEREPSQPAPSAREYVRLADLDALAAEDTMATIRLPAQYEGSAMKVAADLVREMQTEEEYRFGQARVIALDFACMYPSTSPERGFWNDVRLAIEEIQADTDAPEYQRMGWL